MTVQGGESPIDRGALAPLVEHPTRRSIMDALRRRGPLSAFELGGVIDNDDCRPACIDYHAKVLVDGGVLAEVARRAAGPSIEIVYSLVLR
jgi:hypothetical protein